MDRAVREHYCSYCLRILEAGDEECPRPTCSKQRPAVGWPAFYRSGESIDGRFRIRERLGAGGAGVTYRAIDLAADDPEMRDVALKVLHQDRGQGILRDRLRLEGEILRRLEHPHVVPFREMCVEGDEPYYLATGFVPGGSLDDLMREMNRLSARTVLQLGVQLARALALAHSIGVTHRDLKPSNILVRDRGEYPLYIRVADWGIARAVPEFIPRRHVTIQGGFVGTPEFASPEQLRGEPTVGPPTDIFGLGVLMHTLAGGQPIRDLVARGAVDYKALRDGASRYERVPLTVEDSREPHLPLLDELVDQLITRTPEARPDAETVAAYCEELLEAGDTAPKFGRAMSLPALMPAAAFETKKAALFLPSDSGQITPLKLGDDKDDLPRAPSTVEMDQPPTPSEELVRQSDRYRAVSAGSDPQGLPEPGVADWTAGSPAAADATPAPMPATAPSGPAVVAPPPIPDAELGGPGSVDTTPESTASLVPPTPAPSPSPTPVPSTSGSSSPTSAAVYDATADEPGTLAPPVVEAPWPRADHEPLSSPTAVPEQASSSSGVEVLEESRLPSGPVQLHEPSPSLPSGVQPMIDVAPIAERDDDMDEGFPALERPTRWPYWIAALVMVGVVVAALALPGLRGAVVGRVRLLLGGGASLADTSGAGVGRRMGMPSPPRSERTGAVRSLLGDSPDGPDRNGPTRHLDPGADHARGTRQEVVSSAAGGREESGDVSGASSTVSAATAAETAGAASTTDQAAVRGGTSATGEPSGTGQSAVDGEETPRGRSPFTHRPGAPGLLRPGYRSARHGPAVQQGSDPSGEGSSTRPGGTHPAAGRSPRSKTGSPASDDAEEGESATSGTSGTGGGTKFNSSGTEGEAGTEAGTGEDRDVSPKYRHDRDG